MHFPTATRHRATFGSLKSSLSVCTLLASLVPIMLEAASLHQLSGEDVPTPLRWMDKGCQPGDGVRGNYPHTMLSSLKRDGCPPFWEVSQEPT